MKFNNLKDWEEAREDFVSQGFIDNPNSDDMFIRQDYSCQFERENPRPKELRPENIQHEMEDDPDDETRYYFKYKDEVINVPKKFTINLTEKQVNTLIKELSYINNSEVIEEIQNQTEEQKLV